MNLWWAPGQSEPTREICRHLNGKEKAQIYFLSFLFGLCSFAIPLLLFSVMGLGPFDGFPVGPGFALLLVICLALGAWFIIGFQRRILLSTQFARSKGFTMVDLARQPLSRGDYLALGGFAVLVATLGMAGSFMAWFLYI